MMDLLTLKAQALQNLDQASERYSIETRLVWEGLSTGQKSALSQLVTQGPVEDGDVISKSLRDDILHMRLASRACVKGQQGFTVANYTGYDVWKQGQSVNT